MKLGKSSVQWSNHEFRGDILSKDGTTLKKKWINCFCSFIRLIFMFLET